MKLEEAITLDKCKRCGKCCTLRIQGYGMIIDTGERCRYLTNDNLCAVYDNRPSWCLSAEQMMELNVLPQGCGYRGGV
jgi:uncharacterized cysteine cluster protein YcgN (CxxCxxCC family)